MPYQNPDCKPSKSTNNIYHVKDKTPQYLQTKITLNQFFCNNPLARPNDQNVWHSEGIFLYRELSPEITVYVRNNCWDRKIGIKLDTYTVDVLLHLARMSWACEEEAANQASWQAGREAIDKEKVNAKIKNYKK